MNMKSTIKLFAFLLLLCGCRELGMQEETAIMATFPQPTISALANEVSIPFELSEAATSAVQLQLEVVKEVNLEQGTDYHLLSDTVIVDKNSRTGSFTLLLDSEKAKSGNQKQSVEFRLTSADNINTGDARCTVSWQEAGSGVAIAFATTTLRCMENSGKLLLPLKIVGKVERPFSATITSADEKTRQLLNLPASVNIPAESKEVMAEITVTDNSVIDPDYLCTLQLQTPPSVEVPSEGSVCEVNVINDDSSIGFLADEFDITVSSTNIFRVPIQLSGYQTDDVKVKVELTTTEQEQPLELMEDEVTISAETQMGYASVRQLRRDNFKDIISTLTIKETPEQVSVENKQINLRVLSDVNGFTGDWKLFIPVYNDLLGSKLNHYIPVKISLHYPLDQVIETGLENVTYECRFNISKDEIARFAIDANFYTGVASINLNYAFDIYDQNGNKTEKTLLYTIEPEQEAEQKIMVDFLSSATYIPFGMGVSTIYLRTDSKGDGLFHWVCGMQGTKIAEIALVRGNRNH